MDFSKSKALEPTMNTSERYAEVVFYMKSIAQNQKCHEIVPKRVKLLKGIVRRKLQ
jgi:hypothetical protein